MTLEATKDSQMTQPALAPGVYTFYAGHANGSVALYSLYFDGQTMGNPVACNPSGAPNLIGSPCALYDPTGAYAGDNLPRIHVFVVTTNNTVWWLSTVDGSNFITHNEDIPNISTSNRFSALLLPDGIHLYDTDLATNRIMHNWSSTDWTFQTTEPLFTENETAASGVAAVMGDVPYILFGNRNAQPNQPQNALQLYYFLSGTGSNMGNGQAVASAPDQQLDILLYDAPMASLLGANLMIPYKGTQDSQQGYFTTMSLDGVWSPPIAIPHTWTTNSFGSCVYGGRLYCLFQSSSDNSMYLQVYLGQNWLPDAIQVAQNTPKVFWGPAVVAVERGAAAA